MACKPPKKAAIAYESGSSNFCDRSAARLPRTTASRPRDWQFELSSSPRGTAGKRGRRHGRIPTALPESHHGAPGTDPRS